MGTISCCVGTKTVIVAMLGYLKVDHCLAVSSLLLSLEAWYDRFDAIESIYAWQRCNSAIGLPGHRGGH
jgi:hypothetical protein